MFGEVHTSRPKSIVAGTGLGAMLAALVMVSETLHLTLRSAYFVEDLGSSSVAKVALFTTGIGAMTGGLIGALIRRPIWQAYVLGVVFYVAASIKIFVVDAQLFRNVQIVGVFIGITAALFGAVYFLARRYALSAVFPIFVTIAYVNACLGIAAGWALAGGHLIPFLLSLRTIGITVGVGVALLAATLGQRLLERSAPPWRSWVVSAATFVALVAAVVLASKRLPTRLRETNAGSDQPDVFVLSFDALREDLLQSFVESHPESNLAMLSRRGVTFTNIIAPGPATYESLGRNTFPGNASRSTCAESAPARMHARGYYSAFIFGGAGWRFEGSVCYDYYFGGEGASLERRFLVPALVEAIASGDPPLRGRALPADELINKLDRIARTPRPVFAYTHFLELHAPVIPSGKRRDRAHIETVMKYMRQCYQVACDPAAPANAKLIEMMRSAYLEQLDELDTVVGRAINIIEARKRPYRLIVTADHGELFGEHGGFGHGGGFVPELLNVPLVVVDSSSVKGTRRCDLALLDEALAAVFGIGGADVEDHGKLELVAPPLGRATVTRPGMIQYEIDPSLVSQAGTFRNVHRTPQGSLPVLLDTCP
jgi:hypothetical protein